MLQLEKRGVVGDKEGMAHTAINDIIEKRRLGRLL